MNFKEAMKAYCEGKTIQYLDTDGDWQTFEPMCILLEKVQWRVPAIPKYKVLFRFKTIRTPQISSEYYENQDDFLKQNPKATFLQMLFALPQAEILINIESQKYHG